MSGPGDICVCLGDDYAIMQPGKLSLVVMSEKPSSPLRAVDPAVCQHGTG